jgi:hypothetical protein
MLHVCVQRFDVTGLKNFAKFFGTKRAYINCFRYCLSFEHSYRVRNKHIRTRVSVLPKTIVDIRIGQSLARQRSGRDMGARRPQQETVLLHITSPGHRAWTLLPLRRARVRVRASFGEGGRLPHSLAGRRAASGSGDVCLGVQRRHEVLRLQTAVTLAIRPLALWWTLCFGGCPVPGCGLADRRMAKRVVFGQWEDPEDTPMLRQGTRDRSTCQQQCTV